MPAAQIHSGRTSQFWGLAFWLVVVHAAGLGFFCFAVFSVNDIIKPMPTEYSWRALGVVKATAYWLTEHSRDVLELTLLSDIAALFITWRSAYFRRAPRALTAAYLIAAPGTAILVLAAYFILVMVKEIQIGRTTHIYTFLHLEDTALVLLVVTLPAWVILYGIVFKRPPSLPGHCQKCGYDLRASKDRCPECGTGVQSPVR